MSNTNTVVISGNLTRDPEMRTLSTGTDLCELAVAVNHRPYNDEEQVSYFDVKVWGASAAACSKFLEKGRKVNIEGYLQQDRWTTDDGNRSRVFVIARNVEFVGGPSDDAAKPAAAAKPEPVAAGDFTSADDDLPF